jgi:hypothetical protein
MVETKDANIRSEENPKNAERIGIAAANGAACMSANSNGIKKVDTGKRSGKSEGGLRSIGVCAYAPAGRRKKKKVRG